VQAFRSCPGCVHARVFGGQQKLHHTGVQARTDNVSGVLRLVEQLGRHDHISIYRPERHPKLIGGEFSPVLRLAQWILVANDETCADFVTERWKPVVGKTSEHETDIPPCESVSDVRNALHDKGIVPKVGAG
jgi:hypothetical protein